MRWRCAKPILQQLGTRGEGVWTVSDIRSERGLEQESLSDIGVTSLDVFTGKWTLTGFTLDATGDLAETCEFRRVEK
jgi:hypothetical protein